MAIIHKVTASDKSSDSMEFVLSDATPDRYGDIIMADGWVLENFNKNPIALFGHRSDFPIGTWEKLQVKDGALRGYLKMAPKGTSERIDEIRKLIEAGILKAVSVGFRPLESKPISNESYGELYLKQELVETSVVSVPANPNALAVAKGLGISRETLEVVFAKHGNEVTITERSGIHGKHAENRSFNGRHRTMSPLAQRIEDTQARLVGLRDQLTDHVSKMDDDMDDASTATTETLTTQIDAVEKSLEALKRAEAQLAKAATGTSLSTVIRTDDRGDRGSEQPMTVQRVRPFAVPAGPKPKGFDHLIRALTVAVKMQGDQNKNRSFNEVLHESYGDGEFGEMTRICASRMITKAASIPADTTTSGWADTLVQTVIGDFIQSLIPYSVYPNLASKGGSFTYGRNGVISLPARNTATTVGGAFIAQGAPIPVKQGAFTPITLTPKKMGVITTLTREITEHSTPSIEAIIRQTILEDTGIAIDTILLDNGAATTTRPAGIKIGATVTASVTASIVGFVADLKSMVGALITNTKGNMRSPVWIMNPGDVLAATLQQATTGDTPFRQEISGGTLLGIPIIQSTVVVADVMYLVDAADFITATGDTPNFSVSDQAVLHMEDTTPLALGTVATPNTVAAPIRSLWQTDTMAIRMIMDINWALRRTGVSVWMGPALAWN
jgi:HK97 family phage major capsid protein/HK97 family phage prohead protease